MAQTEDTIDRWLASRQFAQPGWYRDPFGRHQARWWDGQGWTAKVADRTRLSLDPLG